MLLLNVQNVTRQFDAAPVLDGLSFEVRPGEALAQPKTAHEAIARFIISEFQAHAVGIILTASEAKILLQPHIAGIVSSVRGLLSHSG